MRTTLSRIEILESRIAPAAANLNLDDLNGTNGFTINGVANFDQLGHSVSGAGDVNGDGFDDLIIATYGDVYADGSDTYVVFGSASGFAAKLDLTTLDGANGFKLSRVADTSSAGSSVSGAGDVNGDGFDDLIIGVSGASPNGTESGASYVVFGKAAGFAANLDLTTLNGANGFTVSGAAAHDHSGFFVSGAGDVNGDGFDDLIIGAPNSGLNSSSSGASYVVFGKAAPFAPNLDLAVLNGANGFKLSGGAYFDIIGFSVSGAGDINGDGFDDLLIGAPGTNANPPLSTRPGASYVVFGKAAGFAANFDLSTLDGANGFKLSGAVNGDFSRFTGASVSGAGDVNGDGFDDLLIGATSQDPSTVATGTDYVVFGKAAGFAANLDLATLDGGNGFKLSGIAVSFGNFDRFFVSGAGDVNGDGFDDLLIGAFKADKDSGASYVVFGKAAGFAPDLDLTTLNGDDGFKLSGAAGSYRSGYSVSGAGDVNGDGFDDLLIGAPYADQNVRYSRFTGASYVVFGFDSRLTAKANNTAIAFQDVDGDLVTIKVGKGTIDPQDIVLGPDGQVQLLKLSQSSDRFEGATIKITAKQGAGGDGLVNVGAIDATGLHLAKVVVKGDLGQIDVGDGGLAKAALKSLTVQSFGLLGDSTQMTGTVDPLVSEILGALPKFTVKTDLKNAIVEVTGSAGRVKIGGDVTGETTAGATVLATLAEFGRIIPRVSGGIPAGSFVASGIGSFTLGGDMHGGSVQSGGDIGSLTVAGGINSGAVAAEGRIPVVKVFGDLASDDPAAPSIITALARTDATSSKGAVAIDDFLVRGDVENARILLGFNKDEVGKNPDASVGRVVVKGNWTASSLAAGVLDATRDGFGQNDTPISGDTTPSIMARIASIVIKGTATGSAAEGDHFGITAQSIGKLSIGSEKVVLSKDGKDDVLLDPTNGDFRLVEV